MSVTKYEIVERWSASDETKQKVITTYEDRKLAEAFVDRMNAKSLWSAYHVRDVEVEV